MHRYTQSIISLSKTLLLLLVMNGYAHAETEIEHEVEDLPYGLSLFHFYQEKYFSAITDLLVAKHYKTLSSQDKNPELLLGGLYLSYGLQHKSAAIFSNIINEEDDLELETKIIPKKPDIKLQNTSPWANKPPRKRVKTPQYIRDRAWFHLGKNHYQNGFMDDAETALTTIKNTLSNEYEAERLYLLSNIYNQSGRLDDALTTLEKISKYSIWKDYAKFNTGAALIRNNEPEKGIALLTELANTKSLHREQLILQDKARLALAYTALKSGNAVDASKHFETIRLNDTESTKALLGIGWSWYQQSEFDKSLTPWMELANREKSDPSVQEALISIPNSFEKIKNYNQALLQYDYAIKTYENQIKEIKKVLQSINNGDFIKRLKLSSLGEEATTPFNILFNINADSNQYLLPLISSNKFHDALKTYQEATYLKYTLNHWLQGLPALELILKEKISRYNSKLEGTTNNPKIQLAKTLQSRRNTLARKLTNIKSSENELMFASNDEQEKLQMLKNAKHTIDKNMDKYEEESTKQKLLYGLVYWDIATDYTPRLWQAEKTLKDLDKALYTMNGAIYSLNEVRQNSPARFEDFSQKIKDKLPRTKALIKKISMALNDQENHLKKMALKVTQQQASRLDLYYDRAMYSRARIYDSLIEKDQ